jgi:hypothetical protein
MSIKDAQGCSTKTNVAGQPGMQFQVERNVNHSMRPFSVLCYESFTLLNAEFNGKQLTKCTCLKILMRLPQKEDKIK